MTAGTFLERWFQASIWTILAVQNKGKWPIKKGTCWDAHFRPLQVSYLDTGTLRDTGHFFGGLVGHSILRDAKGRACTQQSIVCIITSNVNTATIASVCKLFCSGCESAGFHFEHKSSTISAFGDNILMSAEGNTSLMAGAMGSRCDESLLKHAGKGKVSFEKLKGISYETRKTPKIIYMCIHMCVYIYTYISLNNLTWSLNENKQHKPPPFMQ